MSNYRVVRGGKLIYEGPDRAEAIRLQSEPPTEDELLDDIRAMTHEQMARMFRFGSIGDPHMCGEIVGGFFFDRFNELGGMTPEISNKIGWHK